jgi:hypothetical protein
LIVRYRIMHGKVAFYNMDSPNQFDNSASYALSNTPLYSQNTDSWINARTVRQTELERGMRLCLAASMIAQYRGTIPKRMKKYGDIDNLSTFAREYIVNILSAKKWAIRASKGENIDNLKRKEPPMQDQPTICQKMSKK